MSAPQFEFRRELADLVPYEPGKPSEEVMREYDLDQPAVKLASNENPFPPPDALRAVYEKEFSRLNRYPDGGCYYLREALSDYYDWPAEGIVVGGGSDEVLDCLAKATLNPEDEVLTGKPAFIRYRMVAGMMGATPVEVPLTDQFDLDLPALAKKITSATKWICLPNPNNPTSRYCSGEALSSFLRDLPSDLLVILDEAYFELMDADDYPDGTDWLKGKRETPASVAVFRTFSKAYGLAGLRVGYGLMDPAIAREIDKIRPPFNVTRPAQAVAKAALEQDQFLEKTRNLIAEERARMVESLEKRGFDVVPPSANFMLIQPPTRSAAELTEALKQEGVIVRPMAPYGLDEYLRLTVGTPSENDRFLNVLDRIID